MYFIYGLTDPREDGSFRENLYQVFYVGKAKSPEGRLYEHLRVANNGYKSPKCSVIRKIGRMGLSVGLKVLCSAEDEKEIFKLEKQWIKLYGLENLTNLGEGGEGIDFTDEIRQKLSKAATGRIMSEESKRKSAEANRGRRHTKEAKQKISIASKGRKYTEEQKQNIAEKAKRRWATPEFRAKMEPINSDPKVKARRVESRKGYKHSEETKRKMSETWVKKRRQREAA